MECCDRNKRETEVDGVSERVVCYIINVVSRCRSCRRGMRHWLVWWMRHR